MMVIIVCNGSVIKGQYHKKNRLSTFNFNQNFFENKRSRRLQFSISCLVLEIFVLYNIQLKLFEMRFTAQRASLKEAGKIHLIFYTDMLL